MVKTIGIGLSLSSVDLLERLKNRNHVEQIYLSLKLFSILKNPPKSLAFEDLSRIIQNGWEKGNVFLFVGAIGAVNRLISPFLISKEEDPAVLVLDWKALNIVPILGGHFAGANHLAQQLAQDLDGNAIITGDSENHGKLSFKGEYNLGLKTGIWKFYKNNGSLDYENKYKNGTLEVHSDY